MCGQDCSSGAGLRRHMKCRHEDDGDLKKKKEEEDPKKKRKEEDPKKKEKKK